MGTAAGNERVLDALAETIADLQPVDLADRSPPPEVPASESPERYVEHEEIGRGGLGVVLEAFDQDLRRIAAIKRPRDEVMTDETCRALIREAQVTAQLEHPNIPAVYGLGVDARGRPYFAMTRLYGRSLADLLAARATDPDLAAQLTTGRLLRIFLQVGYAVAFAHDRGVLHRDLKAANVVIGGFGEVRLMDWGIAKILGAEDAAEPPGGPAPAPIETSVALPETTVGRFLGTPGYAAPEQVRGDADIDARADVYALGALLYEMITGRPPVVGETMQSVIFRTLAGEIDPIRKLAPVSERLASVVHKALAPARAERYATVLDLVADVEALLEGRVVTAHTEGTIERTVQWYLHRTPRTARMSNLDIDLACLSSMLFGALGGAFIVYMPHAWWSPLGVIVLALAVLAAIRPLYTLLRWPRPDDPGTVIPFREGIASTSRSGSHTAATADALAATEVDGGGGPKD